MTQESRAAGGTAGRSLFYTLLFCSGFAALVYEVAWTRILLSVFGATVYASGTVLTSFMAGMALGSWLASRWGDRLRIRPLRVYAYLELAIGLYAIAFPWILKGVTGAYVASSGSTAAPSTCSR
jgi:spermidine synthase